MIPYSRPKLSDLYTLSQSKLLENHTLHSGTYLYSPHIAAYGSTPPPNPALPCSHLSLLRSTFACKGVIHISPLSFPWSLALCCKIHIHLCIPVSFFLVECMRFALCPEQGFRKTYKDVLTTFQHFVSYLKDYSFGVF